MSVPQSIVSPQKKALFVGVKARICFSCMLMYDLRRSSISLLWWGKQIGVRFHVMNESVCVSGSFSSPRRTEPLTFELSKTKLLPLAAVLIFMWNEWCLWWNSTMRLNGCMTFMFCNVRKPPWAIWRCRWEKEMQSILPLSSGPWRRCLACWWWPRLGSANWTRMFAAMLNVDRVTSGIQSVSGTSFWSRWLTLTSKKVQPKVGHVAMVSKNMVLASCIVILLCWL